jgi:hypothetical protein
MRIRVLVLLAVAAAATAHAQRDAVSAALSPEAAADAFTRGVLDVCVPAIVGNGVSSLAAAREGHVQPTQDAATRRQAGAKPDDTVWDFAAARGVVTIREAADGCWVSVYGPDADATVRNLDRAARAVGYTTSVFATPRLDTSVVANTFLTGQHAGRTVGIGAEGSEPGLPGHESRFSVITASVFAR